jgi:hypothetical protein
MNRVIDCNHISGEYRVKVLNFSVLIELVLQESYGGGDLGIQYGQHQIEYHRLSMVQSTFNIGRVDSISYQYDALGFPESELLESGAVAN